MEGTPAEEAGLKENDIIIKVNDIDVRDKRKRKYRCCNYSYT